MFRLILVIGRKKTPFHNHYQLKISMLFDIANPFRIKDACLMEQIMGELS